MNDDDDDQAWLDLMAGRGSDRAEPRTRAEAAWLRAAMLTYKVRAPIGDMPDPVQRLERLLERAVDAGVLPSAAARPSLGHGASTMTMVRGIWQTLRAALRSPPRVVVAVSVVLAALTLWMTQPVHAPEAPAMRGAPTTQQIRSEQPEQERDRAMGLLRAAGFEVSAFTRLGRVGLEVDVPSTMSQAQSRALNQLGLGVPSTAVLVVEYVAP